MYTFLMCIMYPPFLNIDYTQFCFFVMVKAHHYEFQRPLSAKMQERPQLLLRCVEACMASEHYVL